MSHLSFFVLFQKGENLLLVEKLGGGLAFKLFLDHLIVLIFPHPVRKRTWKHELLTLGALLAELPVCQSSKRKLGVGIVYLTLGRNRAGCLKHLDIHERNTKFQGIRHGHLVCFQKNLLSQPHIEIQVLHLGHVIQIRNLVIKLFRDIQRISALIFLLEEGISLLVLEDIAVSDVTLLHVLTATDQEAFPFEFWKWGHGFCHRFSKPLRKLLIIAKRNILVVNVVPAEHLISAFPG